MWKSKASSSALFGGFDCDRRVSPLSEKSPRVAIRGLSTNGMASTDARWFHVTFATYGTWLPGDPRGFRTRHHREHVEGDYKSPPPRGRYSERHAQSQSLLVANPVRFTPQERREVLTAIVGRLTDTEATVVAVAVGREHVHIVLKCLPGDVRRVVGLAKKNAWFALRERGRPERIWAKRCRAEPIAGRNHQLNAVRYVVRQEETGAAVWQWGHQRTEHQRRASGVQSAGG